MRITFFLGSLGGGGAERVVCNLANFLVSKGHKVEILTMADVDAGYELDGEVKRTYLLKREERKNQIADNLNRIRRLRKHMKADNTDCYVVMLPVTTILMLLFRRITKAKVIAAERVDPANYSKSKQMLLKSLARRADGWVFQTNEIKNWYEDSVEKNNSVVIPNAINESFIRPEYTGTKEKRIVGVGRLTDQKNFKLLIDAFSRITSQIPAYTLTIYGEGPNREALKSQIQQLGLKEKVFIPGYAEDIIEQLEKSSLFVLSSDFEGMPNALMEAMALGLPCISTDCGGGGARFLIEDEINGLLVPVRDAERLASSMLRILKDKDLQEKLRRNARTIVQELRPEIIYSKWEKELKNTCEENKL